VSSGVTLTINDGTVVDLHDNAVKIENGETINKIGTVTFNPDIRLVNGSTLKGQYSTLADACADASSGDEVQIYSDETWSTSMSVPCNVVVEPGVTLTIQSNLPLLFEANKGLRIQGKLTAIDAFFDAVNHSNKWKGIRFDDSSDDNSSIEYCTISYALNGIDLYDASPSISHTTINNCYNYGITMNNSNTEINNCAFNNNKSGIQCINSSPSISNNTTINHCNIYGIRLTGSNGSINDTNIDDCWIGIFVSSGSPQISHTDISNCSSYGISVNNSESMIKYCNITNNYIGLKCENSYSMPSSPKIKYNDILSNSSHTVYLDNSNPRCEHNEFNSSNNGYGMYCYNESSPMIVEENHISYNGETGIYCEANSSPFFILYEIGGNNYIESNGGHGVYAKTNSWPELGYTSYPGNNTVGSNNSKQVKNANSGSDYIYAQYNYWGTPFPKADDFGGNVQYQPYLQNPPNNKNNTAEGEPFIPDADDYVNYFNYTGTEYYAQEKYEQAIADFEFVMINYPDSSQARYALTHVVKSLLAMEKSEEIVPYLDKQMEEYKSHSDFYSFIVFKSIPYLVRNGLYEQAVERIKKLQDVYEKDKDMGAYLQFNLATIYRSCLLDTTNAIAALTAFLEQYEHQDLTPIAKIELEMLAMMDDGFAKRTPQQATSLEIPTTFTLS